DKRAGPADVLTRSPVAGRVVQDGVQTFGERADLVGQPDLFQNSSELGVGRLGVAEQQVLPDRARYDRGVLLHVGEVLAYLSRGEFVVRRAVEAQRAFLGFQKP